MCGVVCGVIWCDVHVSHNLKNLKIELQSSTHYSQITMSRRVIENKESARLLKLKQELSSLKAEIRNYVQQEWYPVTENGNRRSRRIDTYVFVH